MEPSMSTFDTFNTFNYPSIFSEATAMLGAALRTNGFELSQRYRYKEKKSAGIPGKPCRAEGSRSRTYQRAADAPYWV
jgi:hypothetical protein